MAALPVRACAVVVVRACVVVVVVVRACVCACVCVCVGGAACGSASACHEAPRSTSPHLLPPPGAAACAPQTGAARASLPAQTRWCLPASACARAAGARAEAAALGCSSCLRVLLQTAAAAQHALPPAAHVPATRQCTHNSTHHPAHIPQVCLIRGVQPPPPRLVVVAGGVEKRAELKVLQRCAAVQGVVGVLGVVPALVRQAVVHPDRWWRGWRGLRMLLLRGGHRACAAPLSSSKQQTRGAACGALLLRPPVSCSSDALLGWMARQWRSSNACDPVCRVAGCWSNNQISTRSTACRDGGSLEV
jgi:hypothetical protein